MENQRTGPAHTARSQRTGRWDAVALVGLIIAVLIIAGMLAAAHFGMPNPRDTAVRPPAQSNFVWSGKATLTSQTAQQAFASGVQLTPCIGAPGAPPAFGGPARSTTITWLFNGSSYGLARIQPRCDPPARPYHLWLFVLGRHTAHDWSPNGGETELGSSGGASIAQPTPAWLPLPADTYAQHPLGGPSYANVALWDGQTHLFVFGHVADRAIRPAGATSVTVDGDPGWLTTEDGLTTVTSVRADGTTLFFSGTAAPAAVQSLAAGAFAHVDEALQLPSSSTVTPAA